MVHASFFKACLTLSGPLLVVAPAAASVVQPVDSVGLTEKGGQTCILHRVEQGETMYAISRRYRIGIAQIQEANPEIADNQIRIDQLLCIPRLSQPQTPTPAVAETREAAMEVSGSGSLTEPKNAMAAAARASSPIPVPKQESAIPSSTGQKPVVSLGLPDIFWHVLEPGETLFALSRRYEVPLQQLMEANPGLDPSKLSEGMRLAIPGRAEAPSQARLSPEAEPSAQNPQQQALPTPEPVPPARNAPEQDTPTPEPNPLTRNVPEQVTPSTEPVPPARSISESPTNVDEGTLQPTPETPATQIQGPSTYTPANTTDKVKARGIATWIDAVAPNADSDALLALHNEAPVGSTIEVRNLMNNRLIKAKVVGRIPENGTDNRAIIKLSPAAARQLQAHDPKVLVEVVYAQP